MPGLIQPFPPGLELPPAAPVAPGARSAPQEPPAIDHEYAKLRDRRAALVRSLERARKNSPARPDLAAKLRAVTAAMLRIELGLER